MEDKRGGRKLLRERNESSMHNRGSRDREQEEKRENRSKEKKTGV